MGDVVDAARAYSERNRAVGIVVFEGSGNAVTGRSIGQQFVTELQRRNVQARYFVAPKPTPGMMIAYHLGDVAEGPYSVPDAAAKIGDIARMRLAVNRLLSQ